jgi:hypothetical protein
VKMIHHGWLPLLMVSLLAGCATTSAPKAFRAHPQMSALLTDANRIMVIPLKIEIFQISAGGVHEKMDAWCKQGHTNLMAAIEQELDKRPMLSIKAFNETLLSQDQHANLDQTRALFDVVSFSIWMHSYGSGPNFFPEKAENFHYSLGTEIRDLMDDVDVLLLFHCYEHIPSSGKQAVDAGMVVLGLLGGVFLQPTTGATVLNIALVDADSGAIIWYNQFIGGGSADIRNPIKATEIIQALLKDFPL